MTVKIKCRHMPLYHYAWKEVKRLDLTPPTKEHIFLGQVSCCECGVYYKVYLATKEYRILIVDGATDTIKT